MRKKHPFFSVVLPLRLPMSRFRQSLESLEAQTFKDWEAFVVEEGKECGRILQDLKDKRIHRIPSKGSGISAARNAGVAAARGKYVAFLDCGDEWEAPYLFQIRGLIRDFPGAGLYGTNYWVNDGREKWENPLRLPVGWRGRQRYFYHWMFYGRPPFCASSVALPLGLARQTPFMNNLKAGEDILAWFQVALKHETVYLKEPHSTYFLGKPEGKGVYFGPLNHFDWMALGKRLKKAGQLPPEAEKFTVWATLIQVRKMIANGWREQALTLLERCPKTPFPLYTLYLLGLAFLPHSLWKILRPGVKSAQWLLSGGFLSRSKVHGTTPIAGDEKWFP